MWTKRSCGRLSRGAITLALLAAWSPPELPALQCEMSRQPLRLLETADRRPAYVESPVSISTRRGLLLLGVPAVLWAEPKVFDPAPGKTAADTAAYVARLRRETGLVGFLLRKDGDLIAIRPPFPAGLIRKLFAAADEAGTIHVLWFSPPQGSPDGEGEGVVWYLEWTDNRWVPPRIVFSADRFDWSGAKPSLLIGNGSDVHLIIPYYRGQTGGLAYIRRVNGRWATTETQLAGLPSQASAQFTAPDSLLVAFAGIGAPGVHGPNGQHVFVIRVAVSDTIWPPPKLVHFSGLGSVRWLALHGFADAQGRTSHLTLLWNQVVRRSPSVSDTIDAMVSDDAGVTWVSAHSLPLGFEPAVLTQSSDTKGTIHVVAAPGDWALPGNVGVTMYHASLAKGEWSALRPLVTDSVASRPTLSLIAPDTLLLAWGVARPPFPGTHDVAAPVTKYSSLVPRCGG